MGSKAGKALEPFKVHFIGTVTVRLADGINGSRVFSYGEELVVDEEVVRLNTDRLGQCRLLTLIEGDAMVREARGRRGSRGSFRGRSSMPRLVRSRAGRPIASMTTPSDAPRWLRSTPSTAARQPAAQSPRFGPANG